MTFVWGYVVGSTLTFLLMYFGYCHQLDKEVRHHGRDRD